MSLLDDVSVVVTPNGYKAGTLYGVIPVPTLGSEDVVNGDFANSGTSWNANTGWSFAVGEAICAGSTSDINQGVWSPNAQERYQVTFEVKTITAGGVRFKLGGVEGITRTATGIYTENITTTSTDRIRIQSISVSSSDFSGTITNVSAKEYTASDMDVTRATAATRVDENGLVNYAEVVSNTELVNNGDFATDSVWTKNNATIDTNTNKATITITGGGFSSISQALTYTNGNLYRVNATINGTASKQMRFMDNTSSAGGLTPTNGVITMTGSDQNIEITWTANANSNIITFDRHTGSGDYSFTVSSVSIKELDRNNVPRIDYTGGGCPKILAEPQRTNLITYSEDFTQWIKVNYTVQSNVGISPSGNNDASSLTNPSGGGGNIKQNITVTASTNYTFSFYAKKGTASDVKYSVYDNTNGGDIIASTSYYSQINSSTFTRVTVSFATPVGCTSIGVYILRDNGAAGTVIVWGSQLEENSYATSYIPTSGSTVTRNQDQFTRDGISSLIGQTEGSIFLDITRDSLESYTQRVLTLSDGTTNNVIGIQLTAGNDITFYVENGGSNQVAITKSSATTSNVSVKIGIAYKANDFVLYIDGTQVGVDSSGSVPATSIIKFSNPVGSLQYVGRVSNLQLYKTRLTNTQLAALTT